MIIKYKKKSIEIKDVKKVSKFEEGIGMMFRRREKCPAMLFEFKKSTRMKIHSLFVFFSFIGIWLDNKNNVLEIKRVKPWKISISPKKEFYKLIEIPINKKYRREVVLLDESQKDL